MTKRLTTELFIERASIIHGDRYDYSLVSYAAYKTPIEIICQVHGVFQQTPNEHLAGKHCFSCARLTAAKNTKLTKQEFIDASILVHGSKYDYSMVEYITTQTKVSIICPIHGIFQQKPASHMRGIGCAECGKIQKAISKTLTQQEFENKAHEVHNHKYDYSTAIYKNNRTKVDITCSSHGIFQQTPAQHLFGVRCPKCVSSISKKEIEWLIQIGVPEKYRHKTIRIGGKPYYVDAFNPITNTIYEFYGDFWHGNPIKYAAENTNVMNGKTFGELHKTTLAREKRIKDAGYKLITIWETDFNQQIRK